MATGSERMFALRRKKECKISVGYNPERTHQTSNRIARDSWHRQK